MGSFPENPRPYALSRLHHGLGQDQSLTLEREFTELQAGFCQQGLIHINISCCTLIQYATPQQFPTTQHRFRMKGMQIKFDKIAKAHNLKYQNKLLGIKLSFKKIWMFDNLMQALLLQPVHGSTVQGRILVLHSADVCK